MLYRLVAAGLPFLLSLSLVHDFAGGAGECFPRDRLRLSRFLPVISTRGQAAPKRAWDRRRWKYVSENCEWVWRYSWDRGRSECPCRPRAVCFEPDTRERPIRPPQQRRHL